MIKFVISENAFFYLERSFSLAWITKPLQLTKKKMRDEFLRQRFKIMT